MTSYDDVWTLRTEAGDLAAQASEKHAEADALEADLRESGKSQSEAQEEADDAEVASRATVDDSADAEPAADGEADE